MAIHQQNIQTLFSDNNHGLIDRDAAQQLFITVLCLLRKETRIKIMSNLDGPQVDI